LRLIVENSEEGVDRGEARVLKRNQGTGLEEGQGEFIGDPRKSFNFQV